MRRVALLLPLVAALAACGGSSPPPPAAPKLPRALAQTWAQQARQIAAEAAAGQGCAAQQLAATLRGEVAGAEAQVPPALRRPLLSTVDDLAGRIACVPPVTVPPTPPGPPAHGHGKDHGPGKGHGDHGGGGGDG